MVAAVKEYDVIFLHPHRMINDEFEHPLFPMGFISMASRLKSEGLNVGIINLTLEKSLLGSQFEVKSFLKNSFEFKIAAIDLHWWVHSFDSVQLAKECKEVNPNCLTVLGGYTASYFANEILRRFSFIDVVLKGEGETPMSVLAKNYLKGKSLKETPNCVVRERGKIHENPISYVADSLDNLNFTDVSLLNNWEEHLWLHARPDGYSQARGDTVFSPWLCIARGCQYNCSFCGGTKKAHWLCAGRSRLTSRSPEKVVEDISFLEGIGVRGINFSHGPAIVGEKYYDEILSLLHKEHLDVSGFMELWQLPSIDFMEKLERGFNNLTFRIILGSGSEKVRQLNRGILISNVDFLKLLDMCINIGINCYVSFSSNLPFESKETFKETYKLMEKLILEKNVINIFCGNYSIEPASPIFLNPKKYSVISKIRSFMDYYNLLKKRQKVYCPSGYRTKTLSEKDSMNLTREVYVKKNELLRNLKRRPTYYSFY